MTPWDAVLGHEPQRKAWRAMREAGRLPHGLLLTGPEGVGKRLWARAAAADLLCPKPGTEGACRSCPSCRAAARGSHPDLIEAAPANRRYYHVSKTETHDDEISPLLERLGLTPALGERKVLVLDRAEGLRRHAGPDGQQAADAFLKTLEEPPAGTFLFLVATSAGDVVPTIASRCARIPFAPLGREDFRKAIAGRGKAKGLEETLWRLSRGSPGAALALLESGLMEKREALAALCGAGVAQALGLSGAKPLAPAKPTVKEAAELHATPLEIQRQEAVARLDMLASLLRDRVPGILEAERMHPDLALAPHPKAAEGVWAARRAIDLLLGNVELNLTLECAALEMS